MKNLFAFLLAFAMLTGLCTGATAEGPAFDGSSNECAVMEKVLTAIPGQNIAASDMAPLNEEEYGSETRGVTKTVEIPMQYSWARPAPLYGVPTAYIGNDIPIYNLIYSSGASNQYFAIAVFQGTLDSDPVATYIDMFPKEKGFYSLDLIWQPEDKNNTGRFFVVYFTFVEDGEETVLIEPTYFQLWSNPVYQQCPAEGLNFHSFEGLEDTSYDTIITGISLKIGQEGYALLQYDKKFCTSRPDIQLNYNKNYASVEELRGFLVFTPQKCGWFTLTAKAGDISEELQVEICTQNGGHSVTSEIISVPTETQNGVTRYTCSACGAYYEERTWLVPPVFVTFEDVVENSWYCGAVQFAVDRGLFNGVSPVKFAPERVMTRAMLVTVLHRFVGCPEATEHPFTDVATGTWFTDPVAWAWENGIVTGVSKDRFNPEGTITREQLATILYRYAKQKGLDTSAVGDMDFIDVGQVSTWAMDAMSWAVDTGLIMGTQSNGKIYLNPQGGATRAQVATVMMRYIKLIEENGET